jgi:nucleotide-binding universal stress UspA family protein
MSLDGSFASETAARYSLALAKALDADLELLFVAGERSGSSVTRAEESLHRLFRQAQSLGLRVRGTAEAGDPVRVAREHVGYGGVTLAMASVTRPDGVRHLLRHFPCAALLVRVVHPGKMAAPHEILVPVYPGEFQGRGIEQASELLSKLGGYWSARIVLFRLHAPPWRLFGRRPFAGNEEAGDEVRLREFAAALRGHGLTPRTRIAWGRRVGEGITAEAAARRHDLIFVGTEGPKRWVGRGRSRTVEYLMDRSPCDVMLFRPAAA